MEELIKSKLKFIHAADIHLGSVLHTTNYEGIKEFEIIFKEAVYEAFERICSYAIEYKVDFILLSGDIYDKDIRTVKSGEFFYNQCRRLEEYNIHVYVIRGNHDPYGKSEELFNLSENVHVFGSEEAEIFEVYKNKRLAARILGQSYRGKWEGRKMFNSYEPLDNSVYNIGLLHTQLEAKNKKYVPCTVEELKQKEKINYWALGHIHKCKLISCLNPVIAYSGIPQGRDMGEEGVGGCLLVEISEDFLSSISFLPTSSVLWKKIVLNINECNEKKPINLSELEEILIKKGQTLLENIPNSPENLECKYPLSEIIRGYVVQWSIEGRGEIDEILREDQDDIMQYLIKTLNSHFMNNNLFMYTDSVEFNTRREILDIEYLKKTNTAFQEVDKIIQDIFQDENMKKEIVNTFGGVFERKYDKEEFNQEKVQLDKKIIEEIVRCAGEIVIEKLVEKGERS